MLWKSRSKNDGVQVKRARKKNIFFPIINVLNCIACKVVVIIIIVILHLVCFRKCSFVKLWRIWPAIVSMYFFKVILNEKYFRSHCCVLKFAK